MDTILHEKGPQRSLKRNKPTETLVNGSSVVKQQYRMVVAVIHKQKRPRGIRGKRAQEAETQLVSSPQCGVETTEGNKVALSSAPRSPSVTSRSAVFMERAAPKPN